MFLALGGVLVVTLCLLIFVWIKRIRNRSELERHSITAEELHSLLGSKQEVLVLDVRQSLDLLAYSEMIPGAQKIPPKEVLENPSLIPKEKEAVVYCTCPGEKTSRAVLHKAVALHFDRITFLKGGLATWKAKGYPVEPYKEVFRLYTQV